MSKLFKVSLESIIKELDLTTSYMPNDPKNVMIESKNIARLGLELTGFFDHFDNTRLLILGKTENTYLAQLNQEERKSILDKVFSFTPPAVVITQNIEPYSELMWAAKKNGIPVLRSKDTTANVIATVVSFLDIHLAERITRHGVLMEVYGHGVFIIGDSGVGKSETAVELIKRGHRLVADDAVQIRKISDKSLMGSSPKNIRHFIELRGIGVINARRIFGMGSVKVTQEIDLVIKLEIWDNNKVYDRIGVDNEYTEILGVNIPIVTIPVKPGRNLAVIIEVAAMNNRQKKMGYNAAQELLESIGMSSNDFDLISSNQTTLEL